MEIIKQRIGSVEVGPEIIFRNLTMFPLLGEGLAEPDYELLEEALAGGRARITEVSAGGSVPELQFVNTGYRAVFLMDGEALVGAKQNRVLNLSILAPAGKTLVIPVSCVEQGRWASSSDRFDVSPHAHYAAGRARTVEDVSLQMLSSAGLNRRSDQGAVWQGIAAKAARMAAPSPTAAMEAIFTQHAGNLEEYVAAFRPAAGQVGALFAINGQVIGCDLFDSATTLAKLLPKLVHSYALDALEAVAGSAPAVRREAAQALLQQIAQAQMQAYPAVGEGEDARFTGAGIAGGALVARGRVVHLAAFALSSPAPETHGGLAAAIQRASERRRGRMV